ncbi:O-methyltransferase [Streptomyces avicenniae]|uniref:O-methyltransferase n=1 Tax=Streptomyces avicenniae TaxID=500153 RepID=UPI00069AF151|nr:class I SAM-dependent methyltransferase [Streptomyces avicenniae]
MDDLPQHLPAVLDPLRADAAALGFTLSCDARTGALLAALAAARPGARVLELGTGAGEGAAWLLDGMDATASLVSVEQDAEVQGVARRHLGADPRLTLVTGDGGAWLEAYDGPPFDLVFADTWPGKFTHLDRALALVAPGGSYLVDDLDPVPGWPAGHETDVRRLLDELDAPPGFRTVRLAWSTGLLLAVRTGVSEAAAAA